MQFQLIAQSPNSPSLPRLLIDEEFNFWLIKKGGWQKVPLTNLCKVLYYQFVQHPEGISLYDLPHHTQALLKVYRLICWDYEEQMIKTSIEGLTCRCTNSVYEKISKIKATFNDLLPSEIAPFYHIQGGRGLPKKIALPRHLIISKFHS